MRRGLHRIGGRMKEMRRGMRSTAALAIGLTLAAASGACATGPEDEVTASLETEGLVVTNGTSERIHYAVANPRSLALIAIGTDPDATPGLAPGATTTVGFDEIVGWDGDPAAEGVVLYHWRIVTTLEGSTRAVDIHTLEVRP